MPWVSGTCEGERCSMCGAPAAAKVGEEIPYDDPFPHRHNLTAYVCREHFIAIMGESGVSRLDAARDGLALGVAATVDPCADLSPSSD